VLSLGTRASALALAQSGWVADRLREHGIDCRLVELTTTGDRGERTLDKSRWVAELERALCAGEIDVAVHSAKDVPSELAAGTELAAVPAREEPGDVLCGATTLDELSFGARVGTSSLRRTAQLRAVRDDLEIVELRGNVDTRLRKLADGEADAIVLALAGLRRLGRERDAGGPLERLVPAAGQGALALQCLTASPAGEAVRAIADAESEACVQVERTLTRLLGASCHTAVGAHARRLQDGTLELRGWVGLPDGSQWIEDRLSGAVDLVGEQLAERMLSAGAGRLLQLAEEARA
jgi:hydroxymethylbilane synthase